MANDPSAAAMTPQEMLAHWQAHRRLSRRVLAAFPEDQLFTFSVGGMRPYGDLARELVGWAAPMVRGLVGGEWGPYSDSRAETREELLRQWDATTEELESLWPQIAPERFHETITAFGQYTGEVWDLMMYVIDNEIHHRGQGYVYLRALGVEPPPFWERD